MKKPIDKEYLTNTLKSFDAEISETKYLHKDDPAVHTHDNKTILDKISKSDKGTLLFDGKEVGNTESSSGSTEYDILSTSNEVKENAVAGKLVDALVIKEVFQSVSDGKELLASAITDKGVATDANDSFEVMSTNIREIPSKEVNSICPINSPYLFAINWEPVFPSSDSFVLSVPFPITHVKKAVIKKLLLACRKYSTSNTASWYFRILGIRKGGIDEVVISEYSHYILISESNTNYTVNTNIDQDTEIDLSEYEQITGFQLGKNSISGTIVQFKAYLQLELELYF